MWKAIIRSIVDPFLMRRLNIENETFCPEGLWHF